MTDACEVEKGILKHEPQNEKAHVLNKIVKSTTVMFGSFANVFRDIMLS